MENIQVTVEDTVPGDSDDAFDLMLRFDGYAAWWPPSIPTICEKQTEGMVGSELLIKPYPFIKVGWKLHSYAAGREIIIHYYKGMHTGIGIWTFTETEEGKVSISFEIDIVPKNRIFALAYKIFNVRRTHVQQVKRVITALAAQLKQKDAA